MTIRIGRIAPDADDVCMQLLDELRREHDLIDRLLGSLLTLPPAADALAMIEIFETYAGGWHHEREEGLLFPALRAASLPEQGPLAVRTKKPRSDVGAGRIFVPGVGIRWPGRSRRASAARPFNCPIGMIGLAVGTELRPPGTDTAGGYPPTS